jgi:hypothetical protein
MRHWMMMTGPNLWRRTKQQQQQQQQQHAALSGITRTRSEAPLKTPSPSREHHHSIALLWFVRGKCFSQASLHRWLT